MMPRAPIEPEGTFAGLRANAIVFGAFVDIAVTVLASTLLVLGLAPDALSRRRGAPQRSARSSSTRSIAYTVGSLAIGALGTVVGAFVGARRAGQLHVRHGGWIAVTSTAIGVLLTALQSAAPPDRRRASALGRGARRGCLILPPGVTGGALAGALQR